MSEDARLQAVRELLLELARDRDPAERARVDVALAGLDDASRQMSHQQESDQGLQEVADALFGLASLDFSKRPTLKGDGSVLDAVIGCVNMLSEELSAYVVQRAAVEQELERRVEARTAELVSANEQLRHEITERLRAEEALRKTEAQLAQAAKMEAVGRLSGGIAHDFNNLLSVILSYAANLLDEHPAGHPIREDLEEIRRAGLRAAELTRQLLAFSRRQMLELKIIDLNELISSTGNLLRRMIGEDIELKMELEPHIGRVRVDPGQIVQVLMNLAVNARDAMPSGGTLRISTAQVEQLEDTSDAPYLEALSYPCVLLRVSDTGVGMDEATKAHIFEPFFTTKGPGAGTGLGLATVFGIVKQSGGAIRVLSEPGHGTTFEVYLPQSEEPGRSNAPGPELPPLERGSETILLVEDNDQLRQLVRRVLEKNGYQVLDAATPREALALFERNRDSIHLLLTDVVMPQMSGRQLADKLLASRRELKVLYMSGYTEDIALRHGIAEASAAFLQKPFTPNALLRKLREILVRPA
jgi:two-component system, cell cycle sensor histidine kinase and response regulator CckA